MHGHDEELRKTVGEAGGIESHVRSSARWEQGKGSRLSLQPAPGSLWVDEVQYTRLSLGKGSVLLICKICKIFLKSPGHMSVSFLWQLCVVLYCSKVGCLSSPGREGCFLYSVCLSPTPKCVTLDGIVDQVINEKTCSSSVNLSMWDSSFLHPQQRNKGRPRTCGNSNR